MEMITATSRGVALALKVVPNASRDRIVGVLGDRLKVAVAAVPEGGKANAAVCRVLAEAVGVAIRNVVIVAGLSQPTKTAEIAGLDVATVRGRLAGWV